MQPRIQVIHYNTLPHASYAHGTSAKLSHENLLDFDIEFKTFIHNPNTSHTKVSIANSCELAPALKSVNAGLCHRDHRVRAITRNSKYSCLREQANELKIKESTLRAIPRFWPLRYNVFDVHFRNRP